jgi:hypothetical protein
MKKLFTLAACAAALALARPAAAQDPSPARVQAAEALLVTMHADSLFKATMDQMMAAQIRSNPAMAQYEGAMRSFFNKYLRWEDVRGDMVRVYAETYTEDELHQLTAFYQTPLGRRLLETMPQVSQRSAELTQQRVMAHMPELMQTIMSGAAADTTHHR